MKTTLKIEEAAMFLAGICAFAQLPYAWWVFPALLLVPDAGMLGYLANAKTGALTYNLFHHKGIALVIALLGWYWGVAPITLTGIILFAHASFDRMLGYGLKYPDSFHHTHLGYLKEPEKKVTAGKNLTMKY
jgi:hypothetical protein